jgi:hypothetical protein
MKNLLALWLVLPACGLRADVTLQYASTNQFTSVLPAGIMDQAMKQRGVQLPTSFTVRLKGTKAYSRIGSFEFIADLATRQATLLDREGKRYATAPMKEVADKFAAALPQMSSEAQRMLGAMKGNFESKKTGRTDTILGIEAAEREGILTVDGPAMPGAKAAVPMMKMIVRFWTAKPSEVQRIGSLREFMNYSQQSSAFLNPADLIRHMTGKIAGFAQGIGSMIDDVQKDRSVLLKAHLEMQMPFMARMAQQTGKGAMDPDKPFVTVDQSLVEISDAPVQDAVFQVPKGFQPAPMEELIKALMPAE